jgi:hypothetical protein
MKTEVVGLSRLPLATRLRPLKQFFSNYFASFRPLAFRLRNLDTVIDEKATALGSGHYLISGSFLDCHGPVLPENLKIGMLFRYFRSSI